MLVRRARGRERKGQKRVRRAQRHVRRGPRLVCRVKVRQRGGPGWRQRPRLVARQGRLGGRRLQERRRWVWQEAGGLRWREAVVGDAGVWGAGV